MISKEQAYKNGLIFLEKREISNSSIDELEKIFFISKEDMELIPHGKYKGQVIDHYMFSFGQLWGTEERSLFIHIHAHTGEVLYIITPHWYIDGD